MSFEEKKHPDPNVPEVLWERHDFCVVGRVLATEAFLLVPEVLFCVFETTTVYMHVWIEIKKHSKKNTY